MPITSRRVLFCLVILSFSLCNDGTGVVSELFLQRRVLQENILRSRSKGHP